MGKNLFSKAKGLLFTEVDDGKEQVKTAESKNQKQTYDNEIESVKSSTKITNTYTIGRDNIETEEDVLKDLLTRNEKYHQFKETEGKLNQKFPVTKTRYEIALTTLSAFNITKEDIQAELELYTKDKETRKQEITTEFDKYLMDFVTAKDNLIDTNNNKIQDIETQIQALQEQKQNLLMENEQHRQDTETITTTTNIEKIKVISAFDKALKKVTEEIKLISEVQ